MLQISKSLEDYLEAIHRLVQQSGGARVVDVAHAIGVKMPSVNNAVRELTALGLVEYTPYQQIQLTTVGEQVAREIYQRHLMLKKFLLTIGVAEAQAEREACAMEHVLSDDTLQRLASVTKLLVSLGEKL